MTDELRERIVQKLLAAVAADSELKPGDLPWRMREEEWEVFKLNPERFRKPAAERLCGECGNSYPRDELLFESKGAGYCKSCLEIL